MARIVATLPDASVVTRTSGPYLALVSFRRILSLLLLVGLVLAPMSMMSGAPAMAMDGKAIAGMSHERLTTDTPPCHGKQSQSDDNSPDTKQAPTNCCVMMCAAIPAAGGQPTAHVLPLQVRQALPPARAPHGLEPEADPPPPRFS